MQKTEIESRKIFDSDFLSQEGLPLLAKAFSYKELHGSVDKVISLGTGFFTQELEGQTSIHLKNTSKMNILAALALKVMGIGKELIVTGGHTAGPSHLAESEAILNYLKSITNLTDEELESLGINLETESMTTVQNAERSLSFIEPLSNNVLVSTSYHSRRASHILRMYLIRISKQDSLLC